MKTFLALFLGAVTLLGVAVAGVVVLVATVASDPLALIPDLAAGTGTAGPSLPAELAAADQAPVGVEAPPAQVAVEWALAQVGTPYLWGGEGRGGFDCSGLVQAAFARAGVTLPRVAQDQYAAGPGLDRGGGLLPGDLVFFGSSPTAVDHVGIYVGSGEMVDAPHSGADVRVEAVWTAGYVGATGPGR